MKLDCHGEGDTYETATKPDINKDAYWAKTCLSLKSCDGSFLLKDVPNMMVSEGRAALGGCDTATALPGHPRPTRSICIIDHRSLSQ